MSGQFDGDGPYSKSMQALPSFFGGSPPWHMWGNTEKLVLPEAFSDDQFLVPLRQQLIRVSYKRPESWRWVFGARLVSAPNTLDEAGSLRVRIQYDLTIGLGRSAFTMPGFQSLEWVWTGVGSASAPSAPTAFPLWVASAVSPPPSYAFLDGEPVADQTGLIIDRVVAQDIQLSCRASFLIEGEASFENLPAEVEVSAYFSPATHIRPDWLRDDEGNESRFGGNEIGGT